VWSLIHVLCRGPLDYLLNYRLPTMKLEQKGWVGCRTVRKYGPTSTPLPRVLARAEEAEATKVRLRAEQAVMNTFAVRRELDRQIRAIEAARRGTAPARGGGQKLEGRTPSNVSGGGRAERYRRLPSCSDFAGSLGPPILSHRPPRPPPLG